MGRSYESPGQDYSEEENLINYSTINQTNFGIIGLAPKGPIGTITEVSSFTELSQVFGGAYVGDSEGSAVYSNAIIGAQRILRNISKVLFYRLNPVGATFKGIKVGPLTLDIKNEDTTVSAISLSINKIEEEVEIPYDEYEKPVTGTGLKYDLVMAPIHDVSGVISDEDVVARSEIYLEDIEGAIKVNLVTDKLRTYTNDEGESGLFVGVGINKAFIGEGQVFTGLGDYTGLGEENTSVKETEINGKTYKLYYFNCVEVESNGDKAYIVVKNGEVENLYVLDFSRVCTGEEVQGNVKVTVVKGIKGVLSVESKTAKGISIESTEIECDVDGTVDTYFCKKDINSYSSYLSCTDASENIDDWVDERKEITNEVKVDGNELEGAVRSFDNTDTLEISLILSPDCDKFGESGYAASNKLLDELVKSRGDCVALLDYPLGLNVQEVGVFFEDIDEGNATTCYPRIAVKNPVNQEPLWLPASVMMADRIAYTDATRYPWISPAGFKKGKGVFTDAIDIERDLSKTDRNTLYSNCINPVQKSTGKGICLFGNKTFKRTPKYDEESVYTALNVRRMANYIRKVVTLINLSSLFEPNDSITWKNWENMVTPKMRYIKDNSGCVDFLVRMDETTTTQEEINEGKAVGIIKFKPIKALEFISIRAIATEDSTEFIEEESE